MRTILAFILSAQVSWGALDFTAANSHGMVTTPSTVALVPMTISAWAYKIGTSGTRTITGFGNDGTQLLTLIGTATDGWGYVYQGTSGGLSVQTVTKDSSWRNRWVHICAVVESTTSRKIYLDGEPALTNTTSLASGNVSRVYVSGRVYSGTLTDFWGGHISNVGIWSAALTADEIKSLHAGASPKTIRPSSLVVHAALENIGTGGGSGSSVNILGPQVLLTNTVSQAATQPRIYR